MNPTDAPFVRSSSAVTSSVSVCVITIGVLVLLVDGCKERGGKLPFGAVEVVADESGFHPSVITFEKGKPAALVFVRTADNTCATEVVFDDLHVTRALPMNQSVTIDIPTNANELFTFQCPTGQYRAVVTVK